MRDLEDKATELIRRADRQVIPRGLQPVLAKALRPMNSYYTNKIEGQHTTPLLIQQAMAADFSDKPDEAQKQRAAVACMRAEEGIEDRVGRASSLGDIPDYFQADFIQATHRAMYEQLPIADRMAHGQRADGTDWREEIQPGVFRRHEVKVGQHIPPSHACLNAFMQAMWQGYRLEVRGHRALIAICAAHHRLAWLHPFGDGNGRAIRLHTHAGLYALGLTRGFWSPMRGLARQQQRYYQVLALADHPREGDLDGRGNLSEKHLIGFIDFMLDICLDQVDFMSKMLDLQGLEERLHKMLLAESAAQATPHLTSLNSLTALKYLLNAGPTPKPEFRQLLGGTSSRTQDRVIKDLRTLGIITAEGLQAPFQLNVPIELFRYLFPGLWVEAEGG
ncbi:MAG TPA: Fic family protein, partial [Chitinimonas sp.]